MHHGFCFTCSRTFGLNRRENTRCVKMSGSVAKCKHYWRMQLERLTKSQEGRSLRRIRRANSPFHMVQSVLTVFSKSSSSLFHRVGLCLHAVPGVGVSQSFFQQFAVGISVLAKGMAAPVTASVYSFLRVGPLLSNFNRLNVESL